VIQVLCFLTNADHVPVLNDEWTKRFTPRYPNRGIVIVNAIRCSSDRDPDSGPCLREP
jgi:hypothetical protein